MKTRLTAAILGMFLAVSVGFADNIKKREKRQQERINDGVKDGELTKKEALKLEAQEDKLSRQIAKQKHDKQKRKK